MVFGSGNGDDMLGSFLHFINLLIIHLWKFCGNFDQKFTSVNICLALSSRKAIY